MEKINQHSASPTRKVRFAAIGGSIATIIAASANASGIEFLVKLFQYPGAEAGLATLFATVLAYVVKEVL